MSAPVLPRPAAIYRYADNSRHLEAGVGWVSLTTPREEGPRVFEGGSGDEGVTGTRRTIPGSDAGVTDVLVGVPSPGRNRPEGEIVGASGAASGDMVDDCSRAQLVGELDSVLRARPLPPTCEKHLPLESQLSLRGGGDSHKVGKESVEQPLDVSRPPAAPVFPAAKSRGGQNLVSELRTQLSLAANEEIFSAVSSDDERVNTGVLIGDGKDNRDDDLLER